MAEHHQLQGKVLVVKVEYELTVQDMANVLCHGYQNSEPMWNTEEEWLGAAIRRWTSRKDVVRDLKPILLDYSVDTCYNRNLEGSLPMVVKAFKKRLEMLW